MDKYTTVDESMPSARPQRTRKMVFKFRWPIEQVAENEAVCHIPLTDGDAIVEVNDSVLSGLGCTSKEIEAAQDAAYTAVLRTIALEQ